MATYSKGRKFITKFMVDGKRVVRMHDTMAEGEAWELESRAALKRGLPVPQSEVKRTGGADSATIGALLRDTIASRWAKQRDSSRCILNAETFVKWVGPSVSITEALAQETINSFMAHLTDERKVSSSTMNRYKSALSVMIGRVKKKLPELPEFEKYREGSARLRYFSLEEQAAILALWKLWSRDAEADFFVFLIETGARTYTEGETLKWDAVLKDRVLLWETKSGKPRSVPLSPDAKAALERRRAAGVSSPFAGLSKSHMRRLWERTRLKLPQIDDAVIYCCRHTYATRNVMDGMPLMALKGLMGHSSITMTERYAMFSEDGSFAAAQAVFERRHKARFAVVEGGLGDATG